MTSLKTSLSIFLTLTTYYLQLNSHKRSPIILLAQQTPYSYILNITYLVTSPHYVFTLHTSTIGCSLALSWWNSTVSNSLTLYANICYLSPPWQCKDSIIIWLSEHYLTCYQVITTSHLMAYTSRNAFLKS